MADPFLSLVVVGFDAALLLSAVGFLVSPVRADDRADVVELRFIRCGCTDPRCTGVRRVRAPLALSPVV